MNKSSLRWLLAVIVLAAASLACSFITGSLKSAPTETPVPAIPTEKPTVVAVPTSAAQGNENGSTTGTSAEIQVRLTDEQMTKMLTDELKKQSDPVLENPRAHAHDSVVDVHGTINRGLFSGDVVVTLAPSVDEQGKPHLKIQSASFGSMPIPDSMLEGFSTLIDQFMENADPQLTGYQVKSIDVGDGYIVITADQK